MSSPVTRVKWRGPQLTGTDDQVGQLYELMQAIKKRREEGEGSGESG